jgi:putative ABC transport system ATP-binding protein
MAKSTNKNNSETHPLPDDLSNQIIDLYHVYGLKLQNKVVALKGVSFDIKKGEILSILGPSGSGKSTLLLSLGGMLKPTAGKIIYPDGTDITKLPEEEMHDFRRKNIGYVFQEHNLIYHLTAEKNIEMPMKLNSVSLNERRERAAELMKKLEIYHRRTHTPNRLSGGELQRVSIARALANEPQLILADEPTGNLDAEKSSQILDLFKTLSDEMGTSYLICSHDPIVGEFSDRSLEINDGIIIGEHGFGVNLMDLDSSRLLVMDNQNRITLPENAVEEVSGTFLYTWEVKDKGIFLQPLGSETAIDTQKIKHCPNCKKEIPPKTYSCPRCGVKLSRIVR